MSCPVCKISSQDERVGSIERIDNAPQQLSPIASCHTHDPPDSLHSDMRLVALGYREDEETFNQALKSYLQAANCRFVLVGIDGDDNEDQYMFEIFQKVNAPTPLE